MLLGLVLLLGCVVFVAWKKRRSLQRKLSGVSADHPSRQLLPFDKIVQFGGWTEPVPWGGNLSNGAYIEDRLYTSPDPNHVVLFQGLEWFSGGDQRLHYSELSAAIGLPLKLTLDARFASFQPIPDSYYQLWYEHIGPDGLVNGGSAAKRLKYVDGLKIEPGQYCFWVEIKPAAAAIVVYGLTVAVGD